MMISKIEAVILVLIFMLGIGLYYVYTLAHTSSSSTVTTPTTTAAAATSTSTTGFVEYLAGTQIACSANSAVPYVFKTTANLTNGTFGTWNSAGTCWTPATVGIFVLNWTIFANSSSDQEFMCTRNVTPVANGSVFSGAHNSTAQLMYQVYNTSNNIQLTGVFYSSSITDYIGFWQYSSTALTPNNYDSWLRIIRIS